MPHNFGASARGFLLLVGLSSCASHVPATAPAPAPPPATSPPARGEVWTSERFGYRWVLGSGWHFVRPETLGANRLEPWYELKVARPQGSEHLMVAMVVTDKLSLPSAEAHRGDAEHIRTLIEHVESEFLSGGVELLTTSPQRMFGVEVVQVDGVRAGTHVSFRIYERGKLRLEVRCMGGTQSTPWPCDSAFADLDFGTPVPAAVESAPPRPLHVRSESAGFTFDPPDEAWLSTGPHDAMGGAEVVWMWEDKRFRSIAVQALNLSMYPPGRTVDAETVAEGFRRHGRTVRVKPASLGKDDWKLLETDDPEGLVQDLFLLTRNRYAYLIIVTTPKRDPALRERARKGFHFIPK